LAHAAGADILGGLERYFEGEVLAPPNPELADALALGHRGGHRTRVDDAGKNPLVAVARYPDPIQIRFDLAEDCVDPRPLFFVNAPFSARMLRRGSRLSGLARAALAQVAAGYIGLLGPVDRSAAGRLASCLVKRATGAAVYSQQNFFVRFDVAQREGLLQQQHTNDVGDGTDDEVWVDFWPGGNHGFFYQFAVNSNGTHWQYSGENTAYSPTWQSAGAVIDGGFVTTLRIPMKIMRIPSDQWKMQFVRVVRSTGERQIWSYGPQQTNSDDVAYAGALNGLIVAGGIAVLRVSPGGPAVWLAAIAAAAVILCRPLLHPLILFFAGGSLFGLAEALGLR